MRHGAPSLGVVLLFLLGTSRLWSFEPATQSIPIGLLTPPDGTEARSLRQGATLGLELANATSSLAARLVVRGRHGQWGTEGDDASALALDDNVSAIITPSSGVASHQILQVAGRTQVPVVSLCSDSSITGAGIPWAIRIVPRHEEEAQAIFGSSSIQTNSQAKRWAAFIPEGRAGREVARDLLKAAAAQGCALAKPVELSHQRIDWKSPLESVLKSRPEAILLWTNPELAGQLARALRQAGFTGLLAGPGWLRSPAFLGAAGQAGEGTIIPAIALGVESEERNRRFAEAYQNRFGTEPDLMATMAHDAAVLLIELLRKCSDKPAYRAFPIEKKFPGASGDMIFDRNGNRVITLTLSRYREGKFVSQTERPDTTTVSGALQR